MEESVQDYRSFFIFALQEWYKRVGQREQADIIDLEFILNEIQVNRFRFREVKTTLESSVQKYTVEIWIADGDPEKSLGLIRKLHLYYNEGNGRVCKIGNLSNVSYIEIYCAGFFPAMLLDKLIEPLLSPANSNHVRSLSDKTVGQSFPYSTCGTYEKDFLVLERHGSKRYGYSCRQERQSGFNRERRGHGR